LEHRVKPGQIRDTLIDGNPRPERTQAAVHTALAPGFITENYKHHPVGQGFFWGHLYVLVIVEVKGDHKTEEAVFFPAGQDLYQKGPFLIPPELPIVSSSTLLYKEARQSEVRWYTCAD
jgi:hypothetical protein